MCPETRSLFLPSGISILKYNFSLVKWVIDLIKNGFVFNVIIRLSRCSLQKESLPHQKYTKDYVTGLLGELRARGKITQSLSAKNLLGNEQWRAVDSVQWFEKQLPLK